jgi:hypothetical protein
MVRHWGSPAIDLCQHVLQPVPDSFPHVVIYALAHLHTGPGELECKAIHYPTGDFFGSLDVDVALQGIPIRVALGCYCIDVAGLDIQD